MASSGDRRGENMNRTNVLMVADAVENLPYRKPAFTFSVKPTAFCMAAGCGSACCVSGWTGEVFSGGYSSSLQNSKIILELNMDQALALFKPRGWFQAKWDGARAARVLRLMAMAGDGVTGKQIRAWWRDQ